MLLRPFAAAAWPDQGRGEAVREPGRAAVTGQHGLLGHGLQADDLARAAPDTAHPGHVEQPRPHVAGIEQEMPVPLARSSRRVTSAGPSAARRAR